MSESCLGVWAGQSQQARRTWCRHQSRRRHLTPWDLSLLTVDHTQHGILLPMPRTGGGGAQVVVDDLASSLALALGRFYPLAGRLTASEVTVTDTDGESSTTPTPSLVISLCCKGEGAEFVHAVAPGVTVSDIITTPLYTPPVVSSFFPLNELLNVDAVVGSLPALACCVPGYLMGLVGRPREGHTRTIEQEPET